MSNPRLTEGPGLRSVTEGMIPFEVQTLKARALSSPGAEAGVAGLGAQTEGPRGFSVDSPVLSPLAARQARRQRVLSQGYCKTVTDSRFPFLLFWKHLL